jgi:alpha-beta hydrolase superfamily lysophospholipase
LLSHDSDISPEYDLLLFPYASSIANLDSRRRIPDFDTLALSLRTFLQVQAKGYDRLAIVTHSQGGLIAQRYLEGMLADGKGMNSLVYVESSCLHVPTADPNSCCNGESF